MSDYKKTKKYAIWFRDEIVWQTNDLEQAYLYYISYQQTIDTIGIPGLLHPIGFDPRDQKLNNMPDNH